MLFTIWQVTILALWKNDEFPLWTTLTIHDHLKEILQIKRDVTVIFRIDLISRIRYIAKTSGS